MAIGGVALTVWLITLSVIDIRHRRLPDRLTLPGAAVIMLVALGCGRGLEALAGTAALAGLYLLLHLFGGMGGGDVKLALGLGAAAGALGLSAWLVVAFAAPVLTLLWAAAARARVVPHGPSMCLATALAVLLHL